MATVTVAAGDTGIAVDIDKKKNGLKEIESKQTLPFSLLPIFSH